MSSSSAAAGVAGTPLGADTFVVVDVQSGATGPRCNDRFPIRVQALKLVRRAPSAWGQFDRRRPLATFVSGPGPGVAAPRTAFRSTLEPITGVGRDAFRHGMKQTLSEVVANVSQYVPADATVVCLGDWAVAEPMLHQIGLRKGQHYAQFLSLGSAFKSDKLHGQEGALPGFTFNLATLLKVVLDREPDTTNRARDLADLFVALDEVLHTPNGGDILRQLIGRCWTLLQERERRGEKTFAAAHREFEGVCLGHQESTPIGKTCQCGQHVQGSSQPTFGSETTFCSEPTYV